MNSDEQHNAKLNESRTSSENSKKAFSELIEVTPKIAYEPAVAQSQNNPFSRKNRNSIFICLFLTSLSINFDHGIIPAAIEQIKSSYKVNDKELGTFGGLVYVGTAVGAMFLSFFINKLNKRYLMIFAISANGFLVFAFTLNNHFVYLSINRFVTGFIQSLISIYIPIWIDQFAQSTKKTLCMTFFQLSSVSGLIIGFLLTILIKSLFNYVSLIIIYCSGQQAFIYRQYSIFL